MTETFTPQDAALAVAKAQRWENRLLHRTEGMTWMIWGLVTAAIWTTMDLAMRSSAAPFMLLIVLAWVGAGFLVTYSLWRSAALAKPDAVQRPGLWSYALKVAGILAALGLLHFVVKPTTPAYPLALTGLLWLLVGVLNRRFSPLGVRVSLVIGVVVALLGFALGFASSLGMVDMMLLAALVSGAVPLAGGFYQTLRG